MPNYACTILVRTGNASDRSQGCFVADYAGGNFLEGYFDTPIFDGPTNYNASVGTFAPEKIVEGKEYYNRIEFWAFKHDSWASKEGYLQGQVGTSKSVAFGSPFAVDTSSKLAEYIGIPLPAASLYFYEAETEEGTKK
ncbi:MAG: hypothetical protein K0U59_09725 [Gammaproteobacteria bacterium]|nr:hypothetical protein [Gammaproteobacteria bacterium]